VIEADMNRLWSRTRLQSISSRLLLWFLTISLVPCAVLTGITYWISSQSLEKTVRANLLVNAQAKANEVENYIKERYSDVTVMGRAPRVAEGVTRLRELRKAPDPRESNQEETIYRAILSNYTDNSNYENYYIFGNDGELLFRSKDGLDFGTNLLTGPAKDSELAEAFRRCTTLLQAVVSDFQLYPGRTEPAGFVAGPVLNANGLAIGVIALELSNREVFRPFNDFSGLGETGETLVGLLKGETITIVAPLRHDPGAAFKRTIRLGQEDSQSLQRGVQGQRGFGEVINYQGEPVVAVWSYLPSYRWGMVVEQDTKEAYALINKQRLVIMVLLIVTGLIVVLIARTVARNISHPVQVAALVAEQVAGGNLSTVVIERATGETGQLLDAIRKMTVDLRSLIGRIQRSSVILMSTATEIAATSRQQEQIIHEHGTSTNEAVAAVKQISATSQELLKTMNEVNSVARNTATKAVDGQSKLASMDKTMHLLVDSTGSISSKLSVISERAANINLVVTTITKVADQTNLLSINAAIEAEKAGEYGLGFLVVAREIRRLADQTAVATLDIERMVKEMQYSVSAGVMEMDKFSDQVRHGVSEVSQIREQLDQIIDSVQALNSQFDHVTDGMRAQSEGAEQIREAMLRLSEGASQTADSLREFNTATSHMREAIGELKEEVSHFSLGSDSLTTT
jgi:methyl-accepting chemotaxis protein WspA